MTRAHMMMAPLIASVLSSGLCATRSTEHNHTDVDACKLLVARLGCGTALGSSDGSSDDANGLTVTNVCPVACPNAAATKGQEQTTLKFSITSDTAIDWHFVGGGAASAPVGTGTFSPWLQEPELTGGWLRPSSMATPEDGQLAIHTVSAFTTFNVSFEFIMGQSPGPAFCWSTAAFVFQATDAQHYRTFEFPSQGQQLRAEHFWAQVSTVQDKSGWRETNSMQGPVHGVTSAQNWPHTVNASLGSDGMLHLWVDGRPLVPVHVGTSTGYIGLATYNLLGADVARVRNVMVVGNTAPAKSFDKSVGMGRGFAVLKVPKPAKGVITTTRVGNMVRAPNGDLIAGNDINLLRTKDGTSWTAQVCLSLVLSCS
jgi:hypothetical protein